jgi:acetyltransferase-like isoleucine patch superfamily enzyme
MPTLGTAVNRAQAARMRTAEQRRILASPSLRTLYYEWPNGGGLVHVHAEIHPAARILLNAIVDEHGIIGKNVLLAGEAEVDGHVIGRVTVKDKARVDYGATIKDFVTVGGEAQIGRGCILTGRVSVGGRWVFLEDVVVGGFASFVDHTPAGKKPAVDLHLTNANIVLHDVVLWTPKQFYHLNRVSDLQPR